MTLERIREILFKYEQPQLLMGIEQLEPSELASFLAQIETYDAHLNAKQKALLFESKQSISCSPFNTVESSDQRELGEELLRQGKIGCLILAGGQGTRLGWDGPKGCVPVSPIKGKSLFQLFCERTLAASQWAGRQLSLCIMTSPLNHVETQDYFHAHKFFGLAANQVTFFQQGMLPLLDDRGQWLLERPGKIAEGPDGNGHALRQFFETGLWHQWKENGVEYLNIIVVDNALAGPFDFELCGCAARTQTDFSVKAVVRLAPDEKMGVFATQEDKLKVIEYSELPTEPSQFTLSNTGLFCVSMEFIRYCSEDLKVELPLHLARKSAQVLLGQNMNVWKCERFLFDLLDHARSYRVVVCPREKIYAPLKNASGDKSLETVKQALFAHYRDMYQEITGCFPKACEFELDPKFYYPSTELKQQLIKHSLADQEYIASEPMQL